MSAQPLSPAEAAIVARFELAQPAPESWGHAHHWIGTHDHGPVCSVCGIAKPKLRDRAARNAICCGHAAHDHDTHGCAVNVSTHRRTYERCHGLVTVDRTDRGRC